VTAREVPVVERKFSMEVYSRFGNVLKIEYDPWYQHYTGERTGMIEVSDEANRVIHSRRTFDQAVTNWTMDHTEWLDGTWQGQNSLSAATVNSVVMWIKSIAEWAFKSEQ